MEDKVRNKRIKEFLTSMIGFIIGTMVWDMMGYDNNYKRIVAGIGFGIILRMGLDVYYNKKKPDIQEKLPELAK